MSAGVVADTHALIWYLDEPERLSMTATEALDAAIGDEAQRVFISAISLIEICYLIEKGRIKPLVLTRILEELIEVDPALIEIPVDRRVSQTLLRIRRTDVPDMPDRIIAATALMLNLPLVTRDGKIKASGIRTIW